MNTFDVKTKQGLKEFDAFLEGKRYINGSKPTKDDADLFNAMGPDSEFANVVRWFHKVASFSAFDREGWSDTASSEDSSSSSDDGDKQYPTLGSWSITVHHDMSSTESIETQFFERTVQKKCQQEGIIENTFRLNVVPKNDQVDMEQIEKQMRSIAMDGLAWGESTLLPVGDGTIKLQITCIVEDEKVPLETIIAEVKKLDSTIDTAGAVTQNEV